ncbi:MAG: AraC family transcriptional regulator [Pseudomonadales bacterium]|nr:AraC family transcriptional regulator [Pseudomonadales bacterium]
MTLQNISKQMRGFFHNTSLLLILIIIGNQNITAADTEQTILQGQVEKAQKDLLEINRDLKILEEQLLFPSETQVAVFLSSSPKNTFSLDSVKLSINDKQRVHYLYTERELDAFSRGATQKLFTGNLARGKHQLLIVLIGRGPQGRPYRKAAELEFEKKTGATYVELNIAANAKTKQPSFQFKVWQ